MNFYALTPQPPLPNEALASGRERGSQDKGYFNLFLFP